MKDATSLEELERSFKEDSGLPLARGNNPVFGEGNSHAKILAIGEAPGQVENQLGRPFVGRSGQLLRKCLVEAGIDLASDIYITNIVKHRPPENRDPEPAEIEAYRPYLDAQIRLIDPKIIVTLGRYSMNKFIPNAKISAIHGVAQWITVNGHEVMLVPMFHPAAALRGTTVMNQFREDFSKLKSALDYQETMGDTNEIKINTTLKEEPAEQSSNQIPLL